MPYQSDPLQATKPLQVSNTNALQQQTPGGLYGNINASRYGSFTPTQGGASGGGSSSSSIWGRVGTNNRDPANSTNATQWNTNFSVNPQNSNFSVGNNQSNFSPISTGTQDFRQFGDQMYNHTMGRLQPQMDQRNNQIRQQLINAGIREGSEAWNSEFDRMSRANNDMMSAAATQAEQLGLQAQNQYFGQSMANNQFGLQQNAANQAQDLNQANFGLMQNAQNFGQNLASGQFGLQQAQQNYGQQFGYDQLANALQQAQIGANASRASAAASANAARYGADQQNYRAELAHALGLNQLNEQGRQFDVGNITQNQLMDQNYSLGLMDRYNDYQGLGLQQALAQNQMNNSWMGNIGSLYGYAPQSNYTGTNTAGLQMQAGQNMANAQASQNQGMMGLAGGLMSLWPSDKRLKENIVKIGRENGINVYEFEYKDKRFGSGRYRGVMAQEVQHKYPDAIFEHDGYMAVDYSKLPVKMERVA